MNQIHTHMQAARCAALIFILLACIPVAASADMPLATVASGTINGGLHVDARGVWPANSTTVQFELPAYDAIEWAQLYVMVYCGHQTEYRNGTVAVELDGDGDGIFETAFGEEVLNIAAPVPGEAYEVNDHVNRVTSDYLIRYDAAGLISGTTVNARVETGKVDDNFDGRIRYVALVAAYTRAGSSEVMYRVNAGHAVQGSSYNTEPRSTVFDTSTLSSAPECANLKVVHISSTDAAYDFCGAELTGAAAANGVRLNSWSVADDIVPGGQSVLTATRGGSTYKWTLATLTAADAPDLAVTAVTPNGGEIFALEPNAVNATVKNLGDGDAGAFAVTFNISNATSTETYHVAVDWLAAGAQVQVQARDSAIREYGENVTITVTADTEDAADESDEANNGMQVSKTVVYNGYKGKRYTGGDDITTKRVFTLNGGLLYSAGNSTYESSGAWSEKAVAWTGGDLSLPAGASVREARLYIGYNWDSYRTMPDNYAITFNGQNVTPDAHYTDTKGYGGYNYPSGMLACNVTDCFAAGENTVVIKRTGAQNGPSLIGMYVIVIFEDDAATEKVIFLNEEADILRLSASDWWVTAGETTARAPFEGPRIDTSRIRNATLLTIAHSAKATEGTVAFNGETWAPAGWDGTDTTFGVSKRPVTDLVGPEGNEACFRAVSANPSDNFVAANAILVVEYEPPLGVTGVAPSFGYCNGTLVRAAIAGSGFAPGASVLLTEDGRPDIAATNVTTISPSEITCTFDLAGAEPGNRSVRVTNPDSASGVLSEGFRVRLRGDFNGNGEVDIGDVAKVAHMVVGKVSGDPDADFNGNGITDIGDASKIAYFHIGKILLL